MNIPKNPLTKATNPIIAISDAPMAKTVCKPLIAPSAIAPKRFVLESFSILTLTSSRDFTISFSDSGSNILAIAILPIGTSALAINKYFIGIPSAVYPPIIVADILPIPDTNTTTISLLVILPKYLLTNTGLSVCPKNILATATKLSTSVVPNILPTTFPIILTINPITPK